LKKWNKQFPGFTQNPKQWRERWRNHLDPWINKEPWSPDEELTFINKHKIYGNKWAEIAKFLDGRNDNFVKNYFYSSVRKNIRKISMKRVSYENKDNEVEREMTIYLSQYILEMYREYLGKKRKEKNITNDDNSLQVSSNNETSRDPNEESKQSKTKALQTGDKYIIRKLVSLKITPEHIQEYIDMLVSGQSNMNTTNNQHLGINYPNYAPNMNQFSYNHLQPNQMQMCYGQGNRASSWVNPNINTNVQGANNMNNNDDSQLIQSFGQFNLSNQNCYYNQPQNMYDMYQQQPQNVNNSNDVSLDNNGSVNNDPISSLPLHMRTQNKANRSHSINRLPESSQYMKESFLFEKIGGPNSKDDNIIHRDKSPIQVDGGKSFAPVILQNNILNGSRGSSPSKSSQSSRYSSINDGVSCSSLDLSFDGSGNPYLKPFRASAFAKVQQNDNSDRSSSISADDRGNNRMKEEEKELEMESDGPNDDSDSKLQQKSSFFRLKDTSSKQDNSEML